MLSYTFPMYPNKEQKERLDFTLENCRLMYNLLLEELNKQEKVDRKKMQHKVVELKELNPDFNKVYSKTLQYENYRLFSNLSALKGLKVNGKKVGSLRFKGRDWFKTIVYNQSGFKIEKRTGKRYVIHLPKIGHIRIKMHREFEGEIKGLILKKSCGKWYIILQTDASRKDLKCGNKTVGIDLGISSYLVDNVGNRIDNPRILGKHMDKLKELQYDLSRKKKGSNNRNKAKTRVAKLHIKISNIRKDFLHKTSTKIIRENAFIAVERLKIRNMMGGNYHALNRNIADASWNRFLQMLRYKAESAGCEIAEIDSSNTSKTCSSCGNIQDMPLHKRTYICNICGMSMKRDQNSAINILKKASGGPERASAESINIYSMNQEASGFSPR